MAKQSGAQPNNSNGFKGYQFRDALHKALKRYQSDTVERKTALFHIAIKLIDNSLQGDMSAIGMIADRLDGKPAQAITGPSGEPISLVERVIVVQALQDDIIQGEIVPDCLPINERQSTGK